MGEGRNPNWLDPLRLLFAALVLLSHAPELIDGDRHRELMTRVFGTASFGELAVSGFLILSGYLIARAWEVAPNSATYLKNRLLRIGPGYVVAFAFALFVAGAIAAPDAGAYYGGIDWSEIRGSFLTFYGPTGATFPDPRFPALNGAMWSIQLEVFCYLLAPLVTKSRVALPLAWVAFAVIVCLSSSQWARGILMFLSGALYWRFSLRPTRGAVIACAVALPLLMLSPLLWKVGLATAGAYLLLSFGLTRAPTRRWVDVSYGVYLYGWPIQALLILWGLTNPWLLFPVSLGLALLFGAASWYVVEKPALRLKGRTALPEVQTAHFALR